MIALLTKHAGQINNDLQHAYIYIYIYVHVDSSTQLDPKINIRTDSACVQS